MSLLTNKKISLARKPSPPRGDAGSELTFQQKLAEIKRLRSEGGSLLANNKLPGNCEDIKGAGVVSEAKQVATLTGLKTFLKSFGDWVEVVSKSGKVYYYNKKTLVNQWKKPDSWLAEEERLNPPLPPEPSPLPPVPDSQPPLPPAPAPIQEESKFKIKVKVKKKVKKRLNPADKHLPLAYQKNGKRLNDSSSEDEESKKPKLTIENAFEDPDSAPQEQQKLAKLDPSDEIGHIKPPVVEEDEKPSEISNDTDNHNEGAIDAKTEDDETNKDPKDCRKFDPRVSGPERAENLASGCAAALAFKNITSLPEANAIYGENPLPPPSGLATSLGLGNPTYFTEYNLPCCLKRCKFPKEQDVLHELKINKMKRRSFVPPSISMGLDPGLAHLAREAEMEQLLIEIKNHNNHDRLMTSRMQDVMVYKIADEVWERFCHLFQIKVFDGVFLECKPHGYSHNDELIYSRTGKFCGKKTFPEDEVRCQAMLQAWGKSHCLVMYANKIFDIKRDDELWEDDLYEARKFLERNGY